VYPDITLDYIAFGPSMPAWDAGDHDSIRATLSVSADRLARADADFFICPDNTAHIALERPGADLALPGLHIAGVVADQAAGDGRKRVGVLGTKYTVGNPLYPRVLAARGIAAEIPDDNDRDIINEIIFNELVNGVFTAESRQEYVRIIEKLAARGCDAVALVCTEIPMLVTPDVSPLPTLDSHPPAGSRGPGCRHRRPSPSDVARRTDRGMTAHRPRPARVSRSGNGRASSPGPSWLM
jgi:aspartate racemase